MIEIRQATLEQTHLVSNILTEAAEWLIANNQPLWQVESLTEAKFRPAAQRGELYLAWIDGQAVGTIAYQLEDKPFWPDLKHGESAFFHKVAVRRAVAGQGVACAMVEWAIEKTRADSRPYLRMDTHTYRPKLRRFYEGFGFVAVKDTTVFGFEVTLDELKL